MWNRVSLKNANVNDLSNDLEKIYKCEHLYLYEIILILYIERFIIISNGYIYFESNEKYKQVNMYVQC